MSQIHYCGNSIIAQLVQVLLFLTTVYTNCWVVNSISQISIKWKKGTHLKCVMK